MTRARVPTDARILVEVGVRRPIEVAYDPLGPFRILWVVTNGRTRRNFLWVTVRKTGIYVASGGPGPSHTSYHADGRFRWKANGHTVALEEKPPLPDIGTPVLVQSATTVIRDDALRRFELTRFVDRPVDRVVYLDNRVLPEAISYHVWAVPPFRHGDVPLLTVHPAHIHVVTHTNPWIQVVIYEQGQRPPLSVDRSNEALQRIGTRGARPAR
jgi:hypothetical protein